MRIGRRIAVFVCLGCAAFAQRAVQTGPREAAAATSALQGQAASAVRKSAAKQQAAVRGQSPRRNPGGFFALPPPQPLGVPVSRAAVANCPPLPPTEVDALIGEAAARETLDSNLLRSVMRQESGFRPCAISDKGAMGLMQLVPATAEQFGLRNPFSPVENVAAGAKFLKQLLTRYNGDQTLALGAYNAGPAAVDSAHGVPQFSETVEYVNRILSFLGQ